MNTEKIKQSGKSNVLVWIIVALLCLNLITCTRSCKNDRRFKRELREARQADSVVKDRDSVITLRNATIDTLKHELDIAATEKKGLEQQLRITSEAVNQITEAKKNITVSVRQKK